MPAQFMRLFAQVPERLSAAGSGVDAMPPARALAIGGTIQTRWSIRVTGSIRLILGNPQLLLAGYQGTQTSVAIISPLRTGRIAIVDAITRQPLGEALVRRSATDLDIELITPSLRRWSAGVFKLDLAPERPCGLFDAWGGQRSPIPERVPRE